MPRYGVPGMHFAARALVLGTKNCLSTHFNATPSSNAVVTSPKNDSVVTSAVLLFPGRHYAFLPWEYSPSLP